MTADAQQRNATTQGEDPRSVLTLYRRLLALRRERDDLQAGDIAFTDAETTDVLIYRRGARLVVALNYSAEPHPVAWPASARTLLSTHLDREPGTPAPGQLRGGEGIVAELR
jgi:glycosidase